ncbi:hypothetical protein GCM10022222_46190 [Amycolatopsis ultiminotia]|uniref:Uncharacterized protein n=1 Tax=Amycolatopsis ultiminotia TaxID=543629 RepID=A0ABP6WW67_9PSEU
MAGEGRWSGRYGADVRVDRGAGGDVGRFVGDLGPGVTGSGAESPDQHGLGRFSGNLDVPRLDVADRGVVSGDLGLAAGPEPESAVHEEFTLDEAVTTTALATPVPVQPRHRSARMLGHRLTGDGWVVSPAAVTST